MSENLGKLIAALESGEYKKGLTRLHFRLYSEGAQTEVYEDRYCVLGVACEVYIRETGDSSLRSEQICEGSYAYGGALGALPPKVRDWYGFKTIFGGAGDPSFPSLVTLNDGGDSHSPLSFEELAEHIRNNGDRLVWGEKELESIEVDKSSERMVV